MKKILLLLLLLCSMPGCVHSQGEYPNSLVVYYNSTAPSWYPKKVIHSLDGLNVSFGFNQVYLYYDDRDFTIYKLEMIEKITYEYHSEDNAIGNLNYEADMGTSVYSIDGKEVLPCVSSYSQLPNSLPKGVYIIKSNGRTIKIVR